MQYWLRWEWKCGLMLKFSALEHKVCHLHAIKFKEVYGMQKAQSQRHLCSETTIKKSSGNCCVLLVTLNSISVAITAHTQGGSVDCTY